MKTTVLIVSGMFACLAAFCSSLSSADEPAYFRQLPYPREAPAAGFVSASRHPLPGSLAREREAWLVTGERWAAVLVVDLDGMRVVRTYGRDGVIWRQNERNVLMVSTVSTKDPIMDPHPQLSINYAPMATQPGTVYLGTKLRISDQLCTPRGCTVYYFEVSGDTSVL